MADSLIELLAEYVEKPNGHDMALHLYGVVAGRLRTRCLDESEATVIASWFERLAAGEDPAKVFVTTSRGGRKKGREGPDDYDANQRPQGGLRC